MLKSDKISLKLIYVAIITILALSGIGTILLYLQGIQSPYYQQRGSKNFLRYSSLAPMRGDIFDRHGTPLATNRPVISVHWHGTGKKRLTPEQKATLQQLQQFCSSIVVDEVALRRAERTKNNISLVQDISFEQLSFIMEYFGDHPNITVTSSTARYYPHCRIGSHIVGYFRENPHYREGKMGLEKIFEQQLSGSPGKLEYTVNAVGSPIGHKEVSQSNTGKAVQVTLDLELQKIAEEVFQEVEAGSMLVMEPHTGDILIALSRPDFDPNIFLKSITSDEWDTLQDNHPFVNRVCEACYPPASLFKLISITAGLEEGIISLDDIWDCKGHVRFGNRRYHCNRRYTGHGPMSCAEALAYSCNIPFYEIGKKLTINTIAKYAHKFGLGEKTNILLPEKPGLVPTSEWKQQTMGERWWPGETLLATIGQTYCLATPLQMARMLNAICTGYLVKPRILTDETREIAPLAISETTRSFLLESMRETALTGTGRMLKKLPNMKILAKTGTAQTSHYSKRKLGKKYLSHAWFIGHAQYKDNPPITIAIFLEHVGTARHATRKAKQFFQKYCHYCDHHHM